MANIDFNKFIATSEGLTYSISDKITLNSPLKDLEIDSKKRQVLQYPQQFVEGVDTPSHMIVFFFNQNKNTQFKLNPTGEKITIASNSEADKKAFIENLKRSGDQNINDLIVKLANSGLVPDSIRAELVEDNYNNPIPGFIGVPTTTSKVNASNIADNFLGRVDSSLTSVNQERTSLTVAMYMPNDITESVGINYNNTSMSGMTGLATAAGRVGKDVLGQVISNYQTGQDFFRGITMNDLGLGSILSRLGAGGLESLGGYGKAGAAGAGMAINPFMEIIFDNMDFRKFRFNFKFAPSTKEESLVARSIIRAFKFNSAPELANDFLNVFFRVPGTFDIKYYSKKTSSGQFVENPYLNKISTCVCTGVSVNYTGNDGNIFVAFEDDSDPGAPVIIDLSLEFTELELITKQRILEGF